jgi:Fe-S-cluster containining protein
MEAIGRNSPCPCGSGRKYKFCCSPSAINLLGDRVELFKLNRDIAYIGGSGIQRKNFCTGYMSKKQEIFEELDRRQNDIAASGAITCGSGCTHCCILMVGATIQEAELIVYYIYRNEELLNYFIDIYPVWISKLKEVDNLLREQAKRNNASAKGKFKEEPRYDCNYMLSASLSLRWRYSLENRAVFAEQKLYCPFLREGICSIYEVRPFYCAGM